MTMLICVGITVGFTAASMSVGVINPLNEQTKLKKTEPDFKGIQKGYLYRENSKDANDNTKMGNREVPDLTREKHLHLKLIG